MYISYTPSSCQNERKMYFYVYECVFVCVCVCVCVKLGYFSLFNFLNPLFHRLSEVKDMGWSIVLLDPIFNHYWLVFLSHLWSFTGCIVIYLVIN